MREKESIEISDESIQRIALSNGFKLKTQPDGTLALNPYVFEFARALIDHYLKEIK